MCVSSAYNKHYFSILATCHQKKNILYTLYKNFDTKKKNNNFYKEISKASQIIKFYIILNYLKNSYGLYITIYYISTNLIIIFTIKYFMN